MRFVIWSREQTVVNTDPQRRCYNGRNFSETKVWGGWQRLYTQPTQEEADACVKSWQAHDMGGRKCEWKALPEGVAP